MSNWHPVSDFVAFTTKGITPKYVNNSSVVVLNQKCIRDNKINYSFAQFTNDSQSLPKNKFVQNGDILVNSTGTGTAGRCAFVSKLPEDRRLIVDSHILILRCRSYPEAQCLSYILFSFEQKLMEFMTGSSGQSELDKIVLLNLKTNLTRDLDSQRKIANILSRIDSKIELNNEINAELEQMAKTLYDYWFVQFDFPDINGKPYKSSGGKMIWSETLKRKIPELWEVKKISSKIKIGSGYPFKTEDYDDKGKYRIITIKSVQKGNLDTSKADKINFIPDNISGFCKLEKGDVLISLTGNVGRLCFVDQDDLLLNQRVGKLLADSNFANYGYLYFNRQENQKRLEKIANGSSQSNLSPVEAVKDSFPIPEKNILERFSDISNPLFQAIIKTKEENQKFVELRDWLLPMLMNGQVVVN